MENKKALTIDPAPTLANIKQDGRTGYSYARMRGFQEGTMGRILAGAYPHNDDPESVYQKILASLLQDGYLVQLDSRNEAA